MHGALPYVAYPSLYGDVPPSVCLFSHFFVIFGGGGCCFGPGFDGTYKSDIITCKFLCTIVSDRIHHFMCLIKTTWNM